MHFRPGFSGRARSGRRVLAPGQAHGGHRAATFGGHSMGPNNSSLGLSIRAGRDVVYRIAMAVARFTGVGHCDREANQVRLWNQARIWARGRAPWADKVLSSEMRGKVLVIRGGAIGDFILTLPAIAALRAQFPEAH